MKWDVMNKIYIYTWVTFLIKICSGTIVLDLHVQLNSSLLLIFTTGGQTEQSLGIQSMDTFSIQTTLLKSCEIIFFLVFLKLSHIFN